MNRERELAKNTFILTVGKISTQFISFLLLPLYTSLLTPEDFGIVDLLNTYVTLLVPIFNWQFESGMFRFLIDYRDNVEKQKSIISTVLFTNFAQILIYVVFFIIAQGFVSFRYKIFLAIDVALNILLSSLLQLPRGLGDNTTYAVGSFVSAVTTIVFNIVLIAFCHMGALGMFIATVVAKVVTICFLAIKTKVWRYVNFRYFNKQHFKELSRYSFPLVPNQLSWWIMSASDRTVVSHFINIAANGVYSVANKFSSIFVTIYNIFHMSWTESVAVHINEEDSDVFISGIIDTVIRFFGALCMGIIAAVSLAFPFLIDDQYHDAYYQIPILMVAVFFQVVVGLYSVVYTANKKSVEIMKTSIYAAVINLAVDLLLINHIGLFAASGSTLIAYLAMAIYRSIHVRKFVKIHIRLRTILSVALMAIVAIAGYYLGNTIIKVISLVIIAVFGFLLNKGFIKSLITMTKDKLHRK